MPEVFREEKIIPSELMIPAELKYECMIYHLASKFGITPAETGRYTEYDYRLYNAFEKLDQLIQKYYMEQNKK